MVESRLYQLYYNIESMSWYIDFDDGEERAFGPFRNKSSALVYFSKHTNKLLRIQQDIMLRVYRESIGKGYEALETS